MEAYWRKHFSILEKCGPVLLLLLLSQNDKLIKRLTYVETKVYAVMQTRISLSLCRGQAIFTASAFYVKIFYKGTNADNQK